MEQPQIIVTIVMMEISEVMVEIPMQVTIPCSHIGDSMMSLTGDALIKVNMAKEMPPVWHYLCPFAVFKDTMNNIVM